jgi:UDP-N-acetylglucosamine--N-acetylmuramyl-(pentapeptide) pyrophosphoryl-undecaprenol N-acetylglucosamine transferase
LLNFLRSFTRYSGAADLIVTRAGASSLAEFGAQGKACLVVPNPYLAEGHQTKNAEDLASNNAAVVVQEDKLKDFVQPEQGSGMLQTA